MNSDWMPAVFALEGEALVPRAEARAAINAWRTARGSPVFHARAIARMMRAYGAEDAQMRLPDGRHVDAWRGVRLRARTADAPLPTCPHCRRPVLAGLTTDGSIKLHAPPAPVAATALDVANGEWEAAVAPKSEWA